jgi:hypothetical protein
LKQLSISTNFEKQKGKSKKQSPRCFQSYTYMKELLLKIKQLHVSSVWLAFYFLAAEALF